MTINIKVNDYVNVEDTRFLGRFTTINCLVKKNHADTVLLRTYSFINGFTNVIVPIKTVVKQHMVNYNV